MILSPLLENDWIDGIKIMGELVSIIVPVYNAEKYLAECIESILMQSYRNIELIIINDGSKDSSCLIANKYAIDDDRVKVTNIKNSGVSFARNLGIGQATGMFYTFVDADDYLAPNAIQIMLEDIKKYEADIAIYRSSDSLAFNFPAEKTEIANHWVGDESLLAYLEGNSFTYGACANLYRASKFKDVKFPEGRRVHEDSFYIFQCLLKQPKVITQETVVYCYRRNNDSCSNEGYSEKYMDIIFLAKEKVKLIETLKPKLLDKAMNILIRADLSLLLLTCRAEKHVVKEQIKMLVKEVICLKKYYIPCEGIEKKLYWVVTHHIFWMFRFYYRLKYMN